MHRGFPHAKPSGEYITSMHVPLAKTRYLILSVFKWGWQCPPQLGISVLMEKTTMTGSQKVGEKRASWQP